MSADGCETIEVGVVDAGARGRAAQSRTHVEGPVKNRSRTDKTVSTALFRLHTHLGAADEVRVERKGLLVDGARK